MYLNNPPHPPLVKGGVIFTPFSKGDLGGFLAENNKIRTTFMSLILLDKVIIGYIG